MNKCVRYCRSLLLFSPLLLAVVTLPGCAAISLVNTWKDSKAPAKQYRTLLVVGVAQKREVRQLFEDIFAAEIRKNGMKAIASYSITGADGMPSRDAIEEAVTKSGADGVITTRLVGVKKDQRAATEYVITERGYTNTSYMEPDLLPTDLYGFYGANVQYATFKSQQFSVTTSTVTTIETNLFDTGTGRMVWSGTMKGGELKPGDVIEVSEELAALVIKAMARDGFI